jgi:hypothetical protein
MTHEASFQRTPTYVADSVDGKRHNIDRKRLVSYPKICKILSCICHVDAFECLIVKFNIGRHGRLVCQTMGARTFIVVDNEGTILKRLAVA